LLLGGDPRHPLAERDRTDLVEHELWDVAGGHEVHEVAPLGHHMHRAARRVGGVEDGAERTLDPLLFRPRLAYQGPDLGRYVHGVSPRPASVAVRPRTLFKFSRSDERERGDVLMDGVPWKISPWTPTDRTPPPATVSPPSVPCAGCRSFATGRWCCHR